MAYSTVCVAYDFDISACLILFSRTCKNCDQSDTKNLQNEKQTMMRLQRRAAVVALSLAAIVYVWTDSSPRRFLQSPDGESDMPSADIDNGPPSDAAHNDAVDALDGVLDSSFVEEYEANEVIDELDGADSGVTYLADMNISAADIAALDGIT